METGRLIELVIMARQGDADAMEALYLGAKRSVYYLALCMVKNPEDAEDITQEVFIAVHEKISGLREPTAFYKWLNQITASKCSDLLRKYKGIAKLDDEDEFLALVEDDPANLPDKAIDDEATRKIILDVIDGLPDNQRVCVILFYYQQNTITQIADMLDTNENTVKRRLSLARAKIRAALEDKEKKEGIKLYGIPLALTPILRQAMEQFVMPDGVSERIWENVQKAQSIPQDGGNGADPPGGGGDSGTSGRISPKSLQGGAAGQAATGAGMELMTKIIIGIVAAAVVTAGAIIIPRLMEPPSEDIPPPAVTDAAATEPEDIEPPEQSEPECTHIWIEASYQQPKTCSTCGAIEGSPLSAVFEDNGYIVNMTVGVTYDYTTLCYDNLSVLTTGKVTIADYRIISSDETHETMEGYEWRIIRVESEFSDNNAREYGRMFRQKDVDYYSGEMFNIYASPDFYVNTLGDEMSLVN